MTSSLVITNKKVFSEYVKSLQLFISELQEKIEIDFVEIHCSINLTFFSQFLIDFFHLTIHLRKNYRK